jgi:hypothetical protein
MCSSDAPRQLLHICVLYVAINTDGYTSVFTRYYVTPYITLHLLNKKFGIKRYRWAAGNTLQEIY